MSLKILENLWNRAVNPSTILDVEQIQNWDEEVKALYKLGIGMEDTLHFLYLEKPNLERFKMWIFSRTRYDDAITECLTTDVLSEEDIDFWKKNGYVIVKNAISKEDCIDTQQAIWDYLKMDPKQKESWYNRHQEQKGLMLNFSDHETLNRNRFSPRIKKAFEQLYGTDKIYKTIDKVSFNPPETDKFKFLGSPLHWDTSLAQPIPIAYQGLLYLTDCGSNDGAFHCVPGFHNILSHWLDGIEPDENPREKALKTLQPLPILGNAGDFIIWDNRLPHCATANKGEMPRMVQYLTYLPDDYKNSSEWL